MTRIDSSAVVLLVAALTIDATAQESLQRLSPEATGLRVDQVVTICGEALDLACHGPTQDAILTFITPSASPPVSIGAARGAQIDIDTRAMIRAQQVCVTGTVASMPNGYQLQITSRDQIVFATQPVSLIDATQLPRRSCERGVVIPKVRRDVKPQFTADAMRRKISGRIVLQGLVDTCGLVQDVQVIRSLDPGGLDVAAADALSKWEFDPGQSEGKPVSMIVTVDMTFTLK